MKFSIVVPVYNVEKCLHRCVESITNQTYSDIEIILVDDGSTDSCPKICDELAKNDNRIIVIHKKNGGLSDARNSGMKIARGDYIILVDSDDYIETDTCMELLRFTKSKPDVILVDAIINNGSEMLVHPMFNGLLTGQDYLKFAYKKGMAPMAAVLNVYSNSFLKTNRLRFKKGIFHEDEEFTPRVFLCANSVVYSRIKSYHYIIRNDSITTQKDKRKNADDLYSSFLSLGKRYHSISDRELRRYLTDSLSFKYLSLFQEGKLYQYGSMYLHRFFVLKNARLPKTVLKALLYSFSPKLYWNINNFVKTNKCK